MAPLDTIKHLFTRSNKELCFDPVRNWLILLLCALVILIGILVWGIGTFNRISGGQALDVSVTVKVEPKKTFSLEEIEVLFASRAKEMKKYQLGTYTFTDPSL